MLPSEIKSQLCAAIDAHVAAGEHLQAADYRTLADRTCTSILASLKAFMVDQEEDIVICDEDKYVLTYRQPSAVVRAEYIDMLEANSCQGSYIHTVRVHGYNAGKRHHWGLKPGAYTLCKPDTRVMDAFAVIGAACFVAEETHREIWGN